MKSTSQHQHAAPQSTSKRFSKVRIIRNFAIMCVGVVLLFTAYDGLAMLQSTMNRDQGIGVISQTVLYLCFCVSAVLLPKYVIKKFGSKATFTFTMFSVLPYVASNFYSHWILVIPASILAGLSAALQCGAEATYINYLSLMYAEMTLEAIESLEGISSRAKYSVENSETLPHDTNCCSSFIYNNDIKTVVLKSCKTIDPMWGNIQAAGTPEPVFIETSNIHQHTDDSLLTDKTVPISYEPFKNVKTADWNGHNVKGPCWLMSVKSSQKQLERRKIIESTTARFFGCHGVAYLSCNIWSNLMTYSILQSDITVSNNRSNASCTCGANFCNVESSCFVENIAAPSDQIRYILTAACVCVGVISVLVVFFFLDPLEAEKKEVSFSTDLLLATYELAKTKQLLLLIPSSFCVGMAQGFYAGEFNKSFVGCSWGTYHVGLVAVCYGTVSGFSSFSSGWLVKRLGRIPIFAVATLANLAADVFLLRWSPDAEQPHMFFVAAGLWAVYVGAIWSQLRAFYGVLFKENEEAAFAVFHVWYSLGSALSFAYSNFFCTFVKIYVLIAFSLLGFVGYLAVEITHLKNKNKS